MVQFGFQRNSEYFSIFLTLGLLLPNIEVAFLETLVCKYLKFDHED